MRRRNAAIIALKMYKHLEEQIRMKKSQLSLLESGMIKTSKFSDDTPGGGKKDIFEQYDDLFVKKESLRMEVLDLELRKSAIDEALKLMAEGDEIMIEAREVILLKHIKHESIKKISWKMNLSTATVERRIRKGENEFVRLFNLSGYQRAC